MPFQTEHVARVDLQISMTTISGTRFPNTPYFMVELPETEQTTLSALSSSRQTGLLQSPALHPALVPAPCEQPTSPCSCLFQACSV